MADSKDKKNWTKKPKSPIVMSDAHNLRVLYEDNHIIAVNKRNSDIIQSDSSGDTTLCEVVRGYVKHKYNKPGKAFIGTIHRLDRPVSGVILYARTTKGPIECSICSSTARCKTYWAIVKNRPPQMEGHIASHLVKNERQNKVLRLTRLPKGARRVNCYRVIGAVITITCWRCTPKLGVTIRSATLSSLGCPVKVTSNTAPSAPTITLYPPARGVSSLCTRSSANPFASWLHP